MVMDRISHRAGSPCGSPAAARRGCGSRRKDPNDIAGTPWAADVAGLRLGREMIMFRRFMSTSDVEEKQRNTVRNVVQDCMQGIKATATVKLVGEGVYGMGKFDSPLHLVVEGMASDEVDSAAEQLVEAFLNVGYAEAQRWGVTVQCRAVPYDIPVTVTLETAARSTQRQRCVGFARLLKAGTTGRLAGLAGFVLISVLEGCRLFETLPQFNKEALLVMLLAYGRMMASGDGSAASAAAGAAGLAGVETGSTHSSSDDTAFSEGDEGEDPAEFLKGFMGFIGSDKFFCPQAAAKGVRVDASTGMQHTDTGRLEVVDPVTGADLAEGCGLQAMMRLRLTMTSCLSQMTVTEKDLMHRLPTATGPRTVLSTVIAYHDYWPRSFMIARSLPEPCSTPLAPARTPPSPAFQIYNLL